MGAAADVGNVVGRGLEAIPVDTAGIVGTRPMAGVCSAACRGEGKLDCFGGTRPMAGVCTRRVACESANLCMENFKLLSVVGCTRPVAGVCKRFKDLAFGIGVAVVRDSIAVSGTCAFVEPFDEQLTNPTGFGEVPSHH
jgi:hypothetical protein